MRDVPFTSNKSENNKHLALARLYHMAELAKLKDLYKSITVDSNSLLRWSESKIEPLGRSSRLEMRRRVATSVKSLAGVSAGDIPYLPLETYARPVPLLSSLLPSQ